MPDILATMLPLRGAKLLSFSVLMACFSIFAMCGIVFGIPSLYPSLYGWGYFAQSCSPTAVSEWEAKTSLLHGVSDSPKLCDAQMNYVSLASSITFFMADAAAGLWGELVDRLGPRQCFVAASLMSLAGLMTLSVLFTSTAISAMRDVAMTSALALLGFAGPGIFNGAYIGCLAIVTESPSHVSAFTAYSAACFDGSALVFGIIYLIGVKIGLGLVSSTLAWVMLACVLRALFLHCLDEHRMQQLMVMCEAAMNGKDASVERGPNAGLKPAPVDPMEIEEIEAGPGVGSIGGLQAGPSGVGPDAHRSTPAAASARPTETSGLLGAPTAAEVLLPAVAASEPRCCGGLLSVLFNRGNVAVVFLMVSLNLVNAFYLQTQADQVGLLFSPGTARLLETLLEFGFPLLGFVTALWAAPNVFERYSDRELMCWAFPSVLGILFCAVQMLNNVPGQMVATLLFGPMRTLQWACYFNCLAVAPRYPQAVAGRVLGYNNVVIALVSDTIPFALTSYISHDDAEDAVEIMRYGHIRVLLILPVIASAAILAVVLRGTLHRK